MTENRILQYDGIDLSIDTSDTENEISDVSEYIVQEATLKRNSEVV